jgi:hypothetical protein
MSRKTVIVEEDTERREVGEVGAEDRSGEE